MLRECTACGKTNRVPAAHLADAGKCGACKNALAPVEVPLAVDPVLFDEVLSQAKVPVLVDFWADWCMPCRMAAPELERTAREMAGRALVLKVDTDAHPELAGRFGVRGIPHFVVLQGGHVKKQHSGLVRSAEMVRWLS